jgi:hypothetical protein
MSVNFPNTASLLYRQETSPWYNGFNAPGSGSDGQLSFNNMDYNWYYLNSASYQTIEVIKGAAYTGSANTFTEPQTFTSNVGISGSLTGSMARFSGQVISSYPGVGFFGTASWAANAITSSVYNITSSVSASYASSSDSASYIYVASNNSTNTDYSLVFKNSSGALNNYYQLAADGTNGPYFNPSTNTLHGVSLTISASNISASKGTFTQLTGSLSGSLDGTASYATSASYALTSSYAANGVTNLAVGAFSDRTTQTVAQDTSGSLTFNTTDIADGVTLGISPNNSRMIVSKAGTYNLQFSVQVAMSSGANGTAYLWLRKNGVNQTYTNTGVYMQNTNDKHVAAWNFVVNLIAGDYLELVMWAQGGDIQALTEAPVPGPGGNGNVGVPSIIATVTQIK